MTQQQLNDAIIAHALDLQRYSAGQEAEAEATLRQLEADLRALLPSLEGANKREVEALIAEAEKAIKARYDIVAGQVDFAGLTQAVAERTAAVLQMAMPRVLRLSRETLASLSRKVLIEGAPSKDWWANQDSKLAFRFAQQVRQGVSNGETIGRITQRIVGGKGEPGILDVTRREARTLVHSSVMSAANHARLATFRKNREGADGVKWLSTLDSHTCLRCAALDGMAWDFDGKPINGNTIAFMTPQAHMNCRCILTCLPSSLDAILGTTGLDAEIAARRRRASSEGQITGDTTMTGYLKRNPKEAAEILGVRRVAKFQAGKLTLRDLVSGTGRQLTLKELAAR